MGWRKWTILDGDLARCSELQRPRRYVELRPWGSFNAAASMTEWLVWQHLVRDWPGLGTCSNRTVVVQ